MSSTPSTSRRVVTLKPCHTKSFKINIPKLTCSSSNTRGSLKLPRVKWIPHNMKLSFHSTILLISILISILVGMSEAQQSRQMSHNNLQSNNDRITNGIFMQLPFSNPPTVRPPPCSEADVPCPGNSYSIVLLIINNVAAINYT